MSFSFTVDRDGEQTKHFEITAGQTIFLVGPNGSGKSSLMQRIYQMNMEKAVRITAHRQTWIDIDTIDMTPTRSKTVKQSILSHDSSPRARFLEESATYRCRLALFDLITGEQRRARDIVAALESDQHDLVALLRRSPGPFQRINDLFRRSGIPVSILENDGERILARKNDGGSFGVQELSDGERNALLIAIPVLTAPSGSLFLIDEPERHLHRSICGPLLLDLIASRSDCAFIISTHDFTVAGDCPDTRILLMRSCSFSAGGVISWEFDEVASFRGIDETIKHAILGSRRTVLFVEGRSNSLDSALYAVLFPGTSIVPCGSCRDVESALRGTKSSEELHWLRPFGIIDRDGRNGTQISEKQALGLHFTPFYSVEGVYYCLEVITKVAEMQAAHVGGSSEEYVSRTVELCLAEISREADRLMENALRKHVRDLLIGQIPDDTTLSSQSHVDISISVDDVRTDLAARMQAMLQARDFNGLLTLVPVRESQVPSLIARTLRLASIADYQSAVCRLLDRETDVATGVRMMFGSLSTELT
jgi:ABC-type cobalamin/Fe3+-siderophores transport system ATPase subunit